MTTYTEQSGNNTEYNEANPSQSVWDSGTTAWDFTGNVNISLWDTSTIDYSGQAENTVIWTEQ